LSALLEDPFGNALTFTSELRVQAVVLKNARCTQSLEGTARIAPYSEQIGLERLQPGIRHEEETP
jgi:hypothetical protein